MASNRGEWSELYVLFRLLGDKVLYSGDANLNKLRNVFYPILRILRQEKKGKFEYCIEDEIVVVYGNDESLRMPVARFTEMATHLLNEIKSAPDGNFSVPEVESFMETINCFSVKAKSSAKTDITIIGVPSSPC